MGVTLAYIGPKSGNHGVVFRLKDYTNGGYYALAVQYSTNRGASWSSWSAQNQVQVGYSNGTEIWANLYMPAIPQANHSYGFEIVQSLGDWKVEVSGSLYTFFTAEGSWSCPAGIYVNNMFNGWKVGGIGLGFFNFEFGYHACAGMFKNHTELTYFYGQAGSGSAGEGAFYQAFQNTGLTSLPNNAFANLNITGNYAFQAAFMDCKKLTSIGSNITKAANKHASHHSMFMGCTALKTVGAPFTTVASAANYAYQRLFSGCTALEALPDNFFQNMNYPVGTGAFAEAFHGCTALKTVGNIFPKPMALQEDSLAYMFSECSALETIPGNLLKPAMQFNGNPRCCNQMFRNCTSLKLPDDFVLDCNQSQGGNGTQAYYHMFEGCTSIEKLPAGAISMIACGDQNCEGMFLNCTGLKEIDKDAIKYTTIGKSAFKQMFMGCTSLESVPETLIKAATLPENACAEMFRDCTGLKTIDKDAFKNVVTLSQGCFTSMFEGCTSLESVLKNLFADKVLAPYCFQRMFKGCSGLKTIQDGLITQTLLAEGCCKEMFTDCHGITYLEGHPLPESDCAESCYESMFEGCTSLNNVEKLELRPTAFAKNCCKRMFANCSSLKKVRYSTLSPKQPDAEGCYEEMFSGCSSLNHVNVMFPLWGEQELEDSVSNEAGPVTTTNWLAGVAPLGNFNCPQSLGVQYDDSHIPETWEYCYYVKATGKVYFMPGHFATYKGDINYDM